jgi:hypothetical protein
LLIEEQRTNLLLNSDNPDTQVASLAAGNHTLSFVGGPSVTGIDDTIDDNAVDVFVYDTSKDTDGGAWRTGSLAQASSWYAEASSPTRDPNTRSTRAEFPAVAVIVAESNKVTIYDGDDPSLPMWMVFNSSSTNMLILGGGYFVTGGLYALNGAFTVTTPGIAEGSLKVINFVSDTGNVVSTFTPPTFSANYTGKYNGSILLRNSGRQYSATSGYLSAAIVNRTVNDVAMTVLPDAPTDPATGLPVPTIAVATDGGVSVIKDDGTVVDWTPTGDGTVENIYIDADGIVTSTGGGIAWKFFFLDEIPASDSSATPSFAFNQTSTPARMGFDSNAGAAEVVKTPNAFALPSPEGAGAKGLNLLSVDRDMVAYTTSSYTTGWMPGDIKLAALANSATADRSVNNNPLTQNGTITAAPVATGADLMAYSGFSASNYLEQPYNPDLDFGAYTGTAGTGDFSVMGWCYGPAASGTDTILHRASSGGASSLRIVATGGQIGAYIGGGGVQSSGVSMPLTSWVQFAVVKRSGVVEFYQNGVLISSVANTNNVSGTDDTVEIGWSSSLGPFPGSLALLRVSATAPTAEQIAKIYNDEKVLFQPNAKATLTGNSDAVTALAHDPDTNLLHVGTSGGRSVFYGLRRVNETATAVTTAISAVDGLIVEQ